MIQKTIVFDLDDTLIPEIDYLQSAFQEIAQYVDAENKNLYDKMYKWYQNKENVFLNLEHQYKNVKISDLKIIYRNHFPNFDPKSKNRELLIELKKRGHFLGLITDGFSVTQRNKIKALDIESLFDLIIISEEFGSEKPNEDNFKVFHQFGTTEYFYIADNVSKDFITPNKLGWTTVCLIDEGKNIYIQDFNNELIYLPKIKINNLFDFNYYIV
jgi:putative hydrolase of the HAD superfamily